MRLAAKVRAREDISDIVGTSVEVLVVAFLIVYMAFIKTPRLQSLICMGRLCHCRRASDEDT